MVERSSNKALVERKMPEDWRKSFIVPIFKGKGYIQECGNYSGNKIMSMKIWQKIIEKIIKNDTLISENQFGFCARKIDNGAIILCYTTSREVLGK